MTVSKKIIITVAVGVLLWIGGMTFIICRSMDKIDSWENEVVSISIYSEQDNELLFKGDVRAFMKFAFFNGASFIDVNGDERSIVGNVIIHKGIK